jgi:hypothetical protein
MLLRYKRKPVIAQCANSRVECVKMSTVILLGELKYKIINRTHLNDSKVHVENKKHEECYIFLFGSTQRVLNDL